MPVVLDASVTMAWCFLDEATPYSYTIRDRVRGSGAIVPAIWALEVANALVLGERRQRLTQAQSVRFVEFLRILPITIEDRSAARVFGSVLPLAREHGLSAYDASYLELAIRDGLPLATQDERLRAAASGVGVLLVE